VTSSGKALGLRFRKEDARTLRALAAAVRSGEMGQQSVNTFEMAAIAAETGEPMIVYHDDPMEVVEMAAAYIRYGCHRPVIEQLSGA